MTTLRPRSLAMLCYLVAHPGRLVTKAELRQHVWAKTHVTDSVLRASVQEIRAALGDAAAAPRYLETVGRLGYRLVVGGELDMLPVLTAGPIVGRQGEVDTLERCFQRAAQGTRQLVFVSGEAGVGKTTVVDVFLARLDAGRAVRIGRGQCVEHYGEGEPYLSILEVLGQLCRGPDHQDVLAALRRYAPMWLVQLPGLVSETELERLQRQVQGATAARMLRELAEALEVLTAEVPLLLVLEDLQWSDHSTVEALTYLAQRRAPARLLVLGTFRAVETVARAHPLRPMVQELCGRGHGMELRLELLPVEAVAAYVAGRLGGPVAAPLTAFVHARTEGNALFMVNIVEHLVQRRLVARPMGEWTLRPGAEAIITSLPEGLRQFLMRRIEDLQPEARRVLEAASVMGETFAVAAVAAGAECPVADVEARCDALAAQHYFINDTGLTTWPDATSGGSYQFQHVLYQQVLYEQLRTARRMQLHRRIGARLEAGYGARAGEIASQLAVHFERAGETHKALHYWQQVGDNAAQRNAHHEAIAALRKALALLATLPESPERVRRELTLQLALADLLRATTGVGSPDVGEVYTRAYTLCQQVGETPQLARVLWGLSQVHLTRGRVATAGEWAQQLIDLVQRQPDTGFMAEGHFVMGTVASFQGEWLAACTHLEQSWRLSDTVPSPPTTLRGGFVRGVTPRTALARVLWALGYADQARQRCQEALVLARQGDHLPSLAYAECFVGPRLPVLPRRGGHPGACRRLAGPGRRAQLAAPRRAGTHLAGVGARHARRGGRRCGAAPPGVGLSPPGTRVAAPPLARLAGRGVWPGGAAPGRAPGPGRGRDADDHDRAVVVGGRDVSAPGSVAAPAPEPRGPPGGSLFPAGPRGRPPPGGESAGTAGRHEPGPAVAASGQARRSPCAAGSRLPLVHRGL